MNKSNYKAGFVGLIGWPNAGKSTLINQLIGEKVSIVNSKPQTTRQRVVGLYNCEQAQLLFVDTPGVIEAKKGLNHYLQEEYKDVIVKSDVLMAILNIDEKEVSNLEQVIEIVKSAGKPWIAVITKMDLPQKHRGHILENLLKEHTSNIKKVSSLQRPEDLKTEIVEPLLELLPKSPGPLYESESYTTQNTRDLVAELIREKCFEKLHQEIPYGLAVKIRRFDQNPQSQRVQTKIYADLVLNKEGHKPIVVGQGGQQIRMIGSEARYEIEKLLGHSTYLELFVTVKKGWIKNEASLKELGYAQVTD